MTLEISSVLRYTFFHILNSMKSVCNSQTNTSHTLAEFKLFLDGGKEERDTPASDTAW